MSDPSGMVYDSCGLSGSGSQDNSVPLTSVTDKVDKRKIICFVCPTSDCCYLVLPLIQHIPVGYSCIVLVNSKCDFVFRNVNADYGVGHSSFIYISYRNISELTELIRSYYPTAIAVILFSYSSKILKTILSFNLTLFLVCTNEFLSQKIWNRNFLLVDWEKLKLFDSIISIGRNLNGQPAKANHINVLESDNPLIDWYCEKLGSSCSIPLVEKFKGSDKILVAALVDNGMDLNILSTLSSKYPKQKILLVPKCMSQKVFMEIIYRMEGETVLYSECDDKTDFKNTQCLIFDYLGDFEKLFRYGSWAYLGSGFTDSPAKIFAAAVFGIPLSFNANLESSQYPLQLIERGLAVPVCNRKGMLRWFEDVSLNHERYLALINKWNDYLKSNKGASTRIMGYMIEMIKKHLGRKLR